MSTLEVSEELARVIRKEADARGVPLEDFLRSAIRRKRTIADCEALAREQAWWRDVPTEVRSHYAGEFVAIHMQQVVDHDRDDAVLYRRVRERFGATPVLLIPAEGPQDIVIRSPRLSRE